MKTSLVWSFLGVGVMAPWLISSTTAAIPAPPSNPTPAWVHAWPDNYARLTWVPSPGAESYNLHRFNEASAAWEVVASGLPNSMAFDPAGSAEKSYRVTAVNMDGESAPSEIVTTHDSDYLATFIHTPPDWWPYLVTPTTATIQWVVSLVSGADGMLEIGLTPTNFTIVGFNPGYAPGHSFVLTNLSPATRYYYRMTSVGTNRAGVAVAQSFMTPDINHPPVAPDITLGPIVDPWPVTLTLTGTDPDGIWNPLEFFVVTPPTNGTLSAVYYYGYYGPRYVDYTPNPGARGGDSFQYVANDGELSSVPATVLIPSLWMNRGPQIVTFGTNTLEDAPVTFTLEAVDPDGDPLTFEIGGCLHGTISGTAPHLTYTPPADFSGLDQIYYYVNDGYIGGFIPGVFDVDVQAVNDAPVANPQSLSTAEDTALAVTLAGSDVDSSGLTFTVIDAPAHGSLSGTLPALVYTPALNYAGSDQFTFRASDGVGESALATVTVTVTPVNDAPAANPQSLSTAEDTALNVTLTGSDVESSGLTFTVIDAPAHGSLSGTLPALVYTPALNYAGSDQFTFRASDGVAQSALATVTVTVTPVNDAPVANPQSLSTAEDTALAVTLAGSDVDSSGLTFTVIDAPAHGLLSGTLPALVYTPALNYAGSDQFTFCVSDDVAESVLATVTVTVTPVNDAPTANPQSLSTAEDTALSVTLTGSDVESSGLTFTVIDAPEHGSLSGTPPALVYTPALNYVGADQFTFRASDGVAQSALATVTVTVTPVNDAPVANPQSLSTAEDTALSVTLTGSDVESSGLTFAVIGAPAHGSLSGTPPALVYTPALNYAGADQFTFRASDGVAESALATVTVTVTPVNDAPAANPQSVVTAYNTSIGITLTGSDADGGALVYSVLNSPAGGTLSGTAPNLTFTPNIGWSGGTSFTFKVNDGSLDSAAATVSITVQAPTGIPAAPSGLVATAVSKTQINLVWNDNSANEDGFSIERSANGSTWSQIGTVGPNVTSYASTGLTANKTYYYRVRAHNSLGNSGYSNTASAKTLK